MTRLTVLYDGQCRACARFRRWLGAEPAYVCMGFVPFRSEMARSRFPALDPGASNHADLTAVGERGEVWRGAKAWRMCLWALRRHRQRSFAAAAAESARHEHDAALAAALVSWPGAPPPGPTAKAPWTSPAPEPRREGGAGCGWLALLLVALVGLALAVSPDTREVLSILAVLALIAAGCALVQGLVVRAAVPPPGRDQSPTHRS